MAAVSSLKDIFFSFVSGNNNEGSFTSFLIALERQLNEVRPDWRSTHVFLLDNCSIHKTQLARKVLTSLKYHVIYSAPASFLAIPIEGIFGALKAVDFDAIQDPDPSLLKSANISKPSKKQIMMMKIARYLFAFEKNKISKLFSLRLSQLDKFLMGTKV